VRTLVIILGGLALLAVAIAIGRWVGGTQIMVMVAKIFVPLWLAVAAINMWIGVARAGYSVAEELPIFLVIFIIPAAVAVFIWWKLAPSVPAR
jgi:riboflavin transporter FmnP